MSAGCPFCNAPSPRLLLHSSATAHVNYYRCDLCGAVWNVPKDGPHEPPLVVTPSRHLTRSVEEIDPTP